MAEEKKPFNLEDAEPIISDGNYDFFGKQPEEYKQIVLATIQQILMVNSKLLSATGQVYIKIGDQYIKQEENTLKIYYQLIDFLEDLLLFYFDDEVKKTINDQNELQSNIEQRYFNIFLSKQINEARRYQIESAGVLPKDDALSKWCWEQIEKETKQCYRKKLQALLLLYKRKNELSNTSYAKMGMDWD